MAGLDFQVEVKMKRSQVTVLMMIGLVLFILIGLALYFSKAAVKKKSQQGIEKIQESIIDAQPIKEFVASCLGKLAKDAVVMMGKQGGYIYSSQGGTLVDFSESEEGLQFINYNNFKAAYNIKNLPKFTYSPYSSEIPDYPWLYYPYRSPQSTSENFEGIFGMDVMPPLTPAGGSHSMQAQIENYVDSNLPKCANFDIFREQGYEIIMNPSKTSVIIGTDDISVQAKIPLTIAGPHAKEILELSNFSTNLNVRLRDAYYFTKELIESDVENIKFGIDDSKNDRDSFSVRTLKNAYLNDDIVIVADDKSLIYGQPHQYIFARKNRAPALYYIKKNVFEFDAGHVIKEEDLLQGNDLKAEDPDEDKITFTIEARLPDPKLPTVLDRPQIKFNVTASDGSLTDYQTLTANRNEN